MNIAMGPESLEALLRNEVDLAFRWRARAVFSYLDAQPQDEILDCGCGLGFFLMALSRLVGPWLYGLDRSAERLSFAKAQVSGAQVSVCLADACHIPYADERFDKVLLIEMLEHLEDDLAGLREVRRVLKPGGILVVTVPYYNYPFLYDPINWVAERWFGRPIRTGPFAGIWTEHCRLYRRETLLDLLCRAGFEVLDCQMLMHYALPFTHNLVYTVGKGLWQKRKLPGFILGSVDRFHSGSSQRSPWNPMTWLLRTVEWIDRFNLDISDKQTFLNIAVKARKT